MSSELPVLDLSNFWDASVGIWNELAEVPDGFTLFADNGNSKYYSNATRDEVVRISDHWGSGVRQCNWYLSGYRMNNSFLWQKRYGKGMRIGHVRICDLINVNLIEKGAAGEVIVKKKGGREYVAPGAPGGPTQTMVSVTKRELSRLVTPLLARVSANGDMEALREIEIRCNAAHKAGQIGKDTNGQFRQRAADAFNYFLRGQGKTLEVVQKRYGCGDCQFPHKSNGACELCKVKTMWEKKHTPAQWSSKDWRITEMPQTEAYAA